MKGVSAIVLDLNNVNDNNCPKCSITAPVVDPLSGKTDCDICNCNCSRGWLADKTQALGQQIQLSSSQEKNRAVLAAAQQKQQAQMQLARSMEAPLRATIEGIAASDNSLLQGAFKKQPGLLDNLYESAARNMATQMGSGSEYEPFFQNLANTAPPPTTVVPLSRPDGIHVAYDTRGISKTATNGVGSKARNNRLHIPSTATAGAVGGTTSASATNAIKPSSLYPNVASVSRHNVPPGVKKTSGVGLVTPRTNAVDSDDGGGKMPPATDLASLMGLGGGNSGAGGSNTSYPGGTAGVWSQHAGEDDPELQKALMSSLADTFTSQYQEQPAHATSLASRIAVRALVDSQTVPALQTVHNVDSGETEVVSGAVVNTPTKRKYLKIVELCHEKPDLVYDIVEAQKKQFQSIDVEEEEPSSQDLVNSLVHSDFLKLYKNGE